MSDNALSAEDRLEVMDLIARYSRFLDVPDVEGFLNLFRPDAVLDSLGGVATGLEELRTWVTDLVATPRIGSHPAQLIHFVGMPIIVGEGDRCTADSYTIIVDYGPNGELRMPMLGRYDDVFVRVDGRWWFEQRLIRADMTRTPGT